MKRPLIYGLMILTWGGLGILGVGAAEPPRTLNLREALHLAWKANPNLQISRVEELIAGEEVVRARSGFLPKVQGQVSHTLYDLPNKIRFVNVPGAGGFPLTNRNFWTGGVTVDQTIFDFWATSSRYQAAILGKAASRLDTAQTQDNIFLLVCQGYFRVLKAEKLVEVARQEITNLSEQLRVARNLYDTGLTTYNDVLQAEVALADARQRLITAQNDVVNAKAALNKLMGLPIATPVALTEEKDLVTPSGSLEQASETALRQRSDVKASSQRIEQGEKGVTQARSGYFPRLYAQGGFSYQQNRYLVDDSQWFGILGLQWSLFNGFDTRAQVRQAKERVEQLKLRHQDLSEQVRLDVQNAWLAVKETGDRIRVTEKAVAQGEENLRLNQERYKEQVGTATEVIDAQTLLTRTRVNYFNARYDHQLAKAQLLWAVGAINELLPREATRHAP
jgi:outer membrane protein